MPDDNAAPPRGRTWNRRGLTPVSQRRLPGKPPSATITRTDGAIIRHSASSQGWQVTRSAGSGRSPAGRNAPPRRCECRWWTGRPRRRAQCRSSPGRPGAARGEQLVSGPVAGEHRPSVSAVGRRRQVPATRIRGVADPHPGIGLPVRLIGERPTLARSPPARQATSRGQARHADVGVEVAEARRTAAANRATSAASRATGVAASAGHRANRFRAEPANRRPRRFSDVDGYSRIYAACGEHITWPGDADPVIGVPGRGKRDFDGGLPVAGAAAYRQRHRRLGGRGRGDTATAGGHPGGRHGGGLLGRRRVAMLSDTMSAASVAAIPVLVATHGIGALTTVVLAALAAAGSFFDPGA